MSPYSYESYINLQAAIFVFIGISSFSLSASIFLTNKRVHKNNGSVEYTEIKRK